MAWRAGARVSNMEMMQFHPTCLYNLEVKNFLITEAVRGEGGHLINPRTGKRFMVDYDPERLELAPRDVVARAIDDRDQALRPRLRPPRHQPPAPDFVKGHFPTIHDKLLGLGIDMTTPADPGGPRAALHLRRGGGRPGRAHRPAGLYAAGECTESGLHGANRLASNSLLECFVFGEAAAQDILAAGTASMRRRRSALGRKPRDRFRRGSGHQAELDRNPPLHVELCRHRAHHQAAGTRRHRIELLKREVEDYYGHFRVTTDLIELRNLLQSPN
jgi:L-aspartate oxidase